jgi:hypothetical protein
MSELWVATFDYSDYDDNSSTLIGIYSALDLAQAAAQAALNQYLTADKKKLHPLEWHQPMYATPVGHHYVALGPKPHHILLNLTLVKVDEPANIW